MRAKSVAGSLAAWLFLAYGVFSVTVEARLSRDELAIATGLETVVLALVDFLWAGELVSLAWALRVLAVAAPFALYGSSGLFYRDTRFFVSEAFWLSIGLGAVLAIVLVGLSFLARRAADTPAPRDDDSRFMTATRWALRGALAAIVLAFRLGEWSTAGIALVYAGAAIALIALVAVVPRRVRLGRYGVGGLLVSLGVGALVVLGAAKLAVGRNMSGSEAAVGAIPALVVAAIGGAMILRRRAGLR